jgi:hypothetical protein
METILHAQLWRQTEEVFTDPGPATCLLGSGATEDGDQNHVATAALHDCEVRELRSWTNATSEPVIGNSHAVVPRSLSSMPRLLVRLCF